MEGTTWDFSRDAVETYHVRYRVAANSHNILFLFVDIASLLIVSHWTDLESHADSRILQAVRVF